MSKRIPVHTSEPDPADRRWAVRYTRTLDGARRSELRPCDTLSHAVSVLDGLPLSLCPAQVVYSDDGGSHWESHGPEHTPVDLVAMGDTVRSVAFLPETAARVVAISGDQPRVIRLDDGTILTTFAGGVVCRDARGDAA